jgi:hypothetical protein
MTTSPEQSSVTQRVFADPQHASAEDIKLAAREIEQRYADAVQRLESLQGAYNEKSLMLLTQGDLEGARRLALDIADAKTDVENSRAAIDGASAALSKAARAAEDAAEKEQWGVLEALMAKRVAVVTELAQCVTRLGELYRTVYATADEVWNACPRKPGSNRAYVPLMDDTGMRGEFELAINTATGGLYPGLGDLLQPADLVGACHIGHSHLLAMKPAFGVEGFTVNVADFEGETLGHSQAGVLWGDHLATGAVLDGEGWRMPGATSGQGLRFEVGVVDWDAVEEAA